MKRLEHPIYLLLQWLPNGIGPFKFARARQPFDFRREFMGLGRREIRQSTL